MNWKTLAAYAARVYDDENRIHVGEVEYATYSAEGENVFAVAGTNGWRDWGCNLHRAMTNLHLSGRRCRVHSGFLNAALELYPAFTEWRDRQRGAVMLTGHSQGAAIAALLAMLSEDEDECSISRLCCVAMPRIGNSVLRRVFLEQYKRSSYRMYGRKLDPVCALPFFGYTWAGHIVWLPSKFDCRLDHAVKKYLALIAE